MQSKINIGDQSTKQFGQNPISQPFQIPEKPKNKLLEDINYYFVSPFLGCFCFISSKHKKQKSGYQDKTYFPTVSPNQQEITVVPTGTTELTKEETMLDDIPRKNVYISDYIKVKKQYS